MRPRCRPSRSPAAASFPVRRIYCVGRNYAEHAKEMGFSGREPPFFFMKPADAVLPVADGEPARIAIRADQEPAPRGRAGGRASARAGATSRPADAHGHVCGYAVGLDMTRRDLQAEMKKQGRPWDIGKGFDQSAPIGPIAPAGEDRRDAQRRDRADGQRPARQSSAISRELIWSVDEIIEHLSASLDAAARRPDLHRHAGGVGRSWRATCWKARSKACGTLRGRRGLIAGCEAHAMELYNYFRSSASYRVRIALALKGLAYDYEPVHLSKNEQLAGRFARGLAVAPGAAAAATATRVLTQSLAIIEYLDETHPEPPLLPADAARPRARAGARAGHRLRDPSAQQPARAALPGARPEGRRGRQEPLVPALGRDRAGDRRAPARRRCRDRPLLPRRHADAGRLRAGAADLQRAALRLPARPRAAR